MSGCGHIHLGSCAYWYHFIAQGSRFREATADRIVRDLSASDGHAASPFAPDGTCRARHTSNHPRQSILGHSSSRARCIRFSTFSVVESSSLLLREGRRALLAAIFMWHLQCILDALPSGSQVPLTGVKYPVYTSCERQDPTSNIVLTSVLPCMSRSAAQTRTWSHLCLLLTRLGIASRGWD